VEVGLARAARIATDDEREGRDSRICRRDPTGVRDAGEATEEGKRTKHRPNDTPGSGRENRQRGTVSL
jgi:hypothetical protein